MLLGNYPRPQDDNGLGIHIGLDLTPRKVQADLDRVLWLGLRWAVICNPDPELVIKTAKLFWDNGIMPILRFNVHINDRFQWGYWTTVAAETLDFSPYIQAYNEPGDNREWRNDKRPKNWQEIFIDKWLRASNAIAMAGGLPGLQVLSTGELRAVLEHGFHGKAWFCPHNYAEYSLPPDFYKKGEGVGVLSFLDLAEVFNETIGRIPPFIAGEGGWFFDPRRGQLHADYTVAMFESFRTGFLPNGEPTPEYLFAQCFWILS